ncbi:acetyl esterase [Echria macrotheca]|uniref:Acetyl esterase n=1 Tax=Echria macrotheca TaxID=438768 RepID=A0AAJ0BNH6_9PEZI|nr:acetyl esterase [Echria macrotheca]
MDLQSDITINVPAFTFSSISDETRAINIQVAALEAQSTIGSFVDVGAQKYREMMANGETVFPVPERLDVAEDLVLPRRDGEEIPIRVVRPKNGKTPRAVLLHIHGGGFVLMTHRDFDSRLQRWANECDVVAVSVGYRLAPEHPWPTPMDDTIDAAVYLATHPSFLGAPLRLVSGESAGACLAVQAVLHLTKTQPSHQLAGVVLPFGWFDLTNSMPSNVANTNSVIVTHAGLGEYRQACLPDATAEAIRKASPLHELGRMLVAAEVADSQAIKLPPALFVCGTADPLFDDTVLMGVKWMATGSEAVVKVVPGAAHAFTLFPGYSLGEQANALVVQYMKQRLDSLELGGDLSTA